MKNEDKRIAIAEACGWKDMVTTVDHRKELVGVNINRMKVLHRDRYIESVLPIPDYLNDLNAMHEAESTLYKERQTRYYWCLAEVVNPFQLPENVTFPLIHATAAQRAEAFLRTIGRWIDNSAPPPITDRETMT